MMISADLNGNIALVTGASRGIGRAIAEVLASQGAHVLLCARSAEDLDRVASGITEGGGSAKCVVTDVSREPDVVNAISACRAHGRLDILINCAGIGVFGPVVETTTEDWDRIMAVNVRGAFLMCREGAPIMPEGGCIVNVASVVGVKGYINQGAYTASKHALMGLTKVLAQELQPRGIRVHALCPGGVDTELVASARPDLDRSILMRPEKVAEIVLFLVGQTGNAVVDQINVRRAVSSPWFG